MDQNPNNFILALSNYS